MTAPSPFAAMRRLHERGPRSRGLVVDREGVMLGPDAVLVRRTDRGYRCIATDELAGLARMAFGDPRLQRLPTMLAKFARALDAGELVKAQLLGLEIPISELDHDQLARLADAAHLLKSGFDPSQPRDERGRWTGDGRIGAGDAATAAPVQIADASDGVSDAGGILPAAASDGGGSGSSASPVTIPPPPPGTGKVREYAPEEAAKLSAPPTGSKYVTFNDGSVLWSAYSNHGAGGPMLMPKDVSLADNARLGESLKTYNDAIEPGQLDPRKPIMFTLFAPYLGSMDYQRNYSTDGHVNKDYIDVGNYNYGVVAAAAGYSWEEATEASGLANSIGSGDKSRPWRNNPRNLEMIKKGYNDYKAGRIISLGD